MSSDLKQPPDLMLLTHGACELREVKVTPEGHGGRPPGEVSLLPGLRTGEAADVTLGLHLRRCGSRVQVLGSRHMRGPHLGT